MNDYKHAAKNLLADLAAYARAKGHVAEFLFHAEHNSLVRFANSAISLNTTEELVTVSVSVYRENAKGSCALVTDLAAVDGMRKAVDQAAEIARHAVPATYHQSITPLSALPDDDAHFDDALLDMTPQEKLDYVNRAAAGLESDALKLAGSFSSGAVWEATANTLGDAVLYHATTDAGASLVINHEKLKWEVQATQSAARKKDLDPGAVNADLALLATQYRDGQAVQLPLGTHDIVFGSDATAHVLAFLVWLGFGGGQCKRNLSCLRDEHIGRKCFSDLFTVIDDPAVRESFPYAFDLNGLARTAFPFVERGVFRQFYWDRDSADEFSQKETAHTVPHLNLAVAPGASSVNSLKAVLGMKRDKDVLYIPYLHYMNVVNATKGQFTGSSRFGALLLKQDGSVAVPYNVRVTDTLFTLFGNIDWLSSERVAADLSMTYGDRNPTAYLVPKFAKVNNVAVTHANASY